MKTYYARHSKMAISDDVLATLRARERIAIHYPEARGRPIPAFADSESLNPDDYDKLGARRALRSMSRLAQEGGYVVAQYQGTDQLVVGRVSAGSSIVLERYVWHSLRNGQQLYPGREAVLKTLAYEKICVIPPEQQRNVLAIAPQQSTLSQWHEIKDRIERLALGIEGLPAVSDLHHSEQEVLCAEFLRAPSIPGLPTLSALLMPVGRGAKRLDICGVAEDGRRLIAQVKHDHKEHYARDLLDAYRDADCHLILFSGIERSRLEGPVLMVSIHEVYRQFCATRRGSQWLRLMSESL